MRNTHQWKAVTSVTFTLLQRQNGFFQSRNDQQLNSKSRLNTGTTQTSDTCFFNPLQTSPHISMLLHGPISAHGVHTIRRLHEILSQSAFIELRATSTTATELALTIRHSCLTQYLSSFRERPFITEHKRNETMQRVLMFVYCSPMLGAAE